MANETSPTPTLWQQFLSACQSPLTAIRNKSKESPIVTIVAVVLLAQPVISTSVTLIEDLMAVHKAFDPNARPVTEAELSLVNQKVDFIQQLIQEDMAIDGKQHTGRYSDLQKQLTDVQQKLDSKYKAKEKK